MKTKYVIFFAAIVCLFSFPLAAAAQVKLTWKVLKYELTCDLPSNYGSDRDLDVVAALQLKNQTSKPFSRVTLRISDSAKVSSITAGGATADFRVSEEKVTESQKIKRIRITVPSVAAGATTKITVRYKLSVSANSGLSALSPIATQFLPFSYWYPTPTSWYFTEGADFAPVDITVNGLNGRELVAAGYGDSNRFSNGLKGMPFFATGKWDKSEHNGIVVYAPSGKSAVEGRAEQMASVASEAKAFVEEKLGRKIETQVKIVAVNRGSGFSESGTVFVERGAFLSRALDSKTVTSISEAMAKAMLGNVVAVRGLSYGVIREGLSRFISNRFIQKKYGTTVAAKIRMRQMSSYTAIADKDSPLNVVSPVDGYFYSATGNKGAMIWNYISQKYGDGFYETLRSSCGDGELSMAELRSAFSGQKAYLDYSIDKLTEMNLMIGTPQSGSGVTRAALRNLGEIPANVRVVAINRAGKEFSQQVNIPAKGFAEAKFESAGIVRVEVDPEKLYTQTSYKDDVAPREITEDDPLVFIKKEFDRQRFAAAEKNAKLVLSRYPEFEDARVFLGRAQLAQGRPTDAKIEFEKVLDSKLGTPQGIAWALVGLGDVSKRTGAAAAAVQFYNEAIRADADYGTTLAARRGRAEAGAKSEKPAEVIAFFANFDKAIVANSKNAVESLVLEGEIARFSSNVAGQVQAWSTLVIAVDRIDDENWLVETNLNLKLLNRDNETGLAVFRLSKVGGVIKLSGVEVFEVS